MSFSFEGFSQFYPNCPVVSGFGTSTIWARLPNNTTRRCLASGDVKYGKVFVAIAADTNQAYALNPFEGRQLQNRIEQFLKVRSADQEEVSGVAHTVMSFASFEAKDFYTYPEDGRTFASAFGDELKIWIKIDDAVPVVVDTIAFSGGEDVLTYGDTELDLSVTNGYEGTIGICGMSIYSNSNIANVSVGSNSPFAIWHHQIASNLVIIHVVFSPGILVETSSGAIAPEGGNVLAVLVYQISDNPDEEGEVLYRDITFERIFNGMQYPIGADIGEIISRPESDYRYDLPPRIEIEDTGRYTSPTRETILINRYSVPLEQFSVLIQEDLGDAIARFRVENLDNGAFATDTVYRPPFAPPLEALQGWERLVLSELDGEGNLVYTHEPWFLGYTGVERSPSTSDGAAYKVDAVFAPFNEVQYTYQYKPYWSVEDRYPMMILNDEQHTAFEEDPEDDPYILPNPVSEVEIDFGTLGIVDAIAPRGFYSPIFNGIKEDSHLLHYFLNDDRMFHVYQRESNTEAPIKVDEFDFAITLDDLQAMGAPDVCYIGSTARGRRNSPEGDIFDPANWVFDLPEGLADPTTSRISLCCGSLSWRMNEVDTVTIDAPFGTGTVTGYLTTELAFAPFPTRL